MLALIFGRRSRNAENLPRTFHEPAKNLPGTSAEIQTQVTTRANGNLLSFRITTPAGTKRQAKIRGAAVCTPHGVFNSLTIIKNIWAPSNECKHDKTNFICIDLNPSSVTYLGTENYTVTLNT